MTYASYVASLLIYYSLSFPFGCTQQTKLAIFGSFWVSTRRR